MSSNTCLISLGSFIIKHWLTIINVLLIVFIIPILLAPFLASTGNPALVSVAGTIMVAYHTTCHQLPGRSLFIFGYQMAVCSRCFAIYASFLAAGLLFYVLKNRLKTFHILYYALFCVPIAIDGAAQLLGIPLPRDIGSGMQLIWSAESTNMLRVITGAIFGFGSALFVMPYMQQIFEMEVEAQRERITAGTSTKHS